MKICGVQGRDEHGVEGGGKAVSGQGMGRGASMLAHESYIICKGRLTLLVGRHVSTILID